MAKSPSVASSRNEKGQFPPGTSGNPRGGASRAELQAQLDALETRLADALEPNRDGWHSALTGIGTDERDKRMSHKWRGENISYFDIARMWEKNDIIAKGIEARSNEAFRTPWELDIADEGSFDDLKEEVETHLRDIGVNRALMDCDQKRRAFAGAAMLIGADDGRPLDEPLDPTRVRSVEWLNVFEPYEIMPVAMYSDWQAAKFGEPEYFEVTPYQPFDAYSAITPKKVRPPSQKIRNIIHESRLIIFRGINASRYYQSQTTEIHPWWGCSVVPRFYEFVRDLGVAFAGLGILMTDVSQPVITMDGLKEMIASDNGKFKARMAAIEMSRSIARAIFLDGNKEKYERQTTQLTGIPDIWDRMTQRAAASLDIPLSVLIGYSPATLGAPGEGELSRWFDITEGFRESDMSPPLRQLATMSMRTKRQRKLPKRFDIEWHDLKRLSVKDQAESELTQARTDSLQTKNGTVHPDEIRTSRWKGRFSFKTKIDPKKKAPGFAAPLPAGVLPGSTPAVGPNGKPAAKPGAHTVTSYARRDPKQTTATPKIGGGAAPAANRDAYTAGEQITFAGLPILIENPKGSTREWVDTDGTVGSTKMKYDYGEIPQTLGTDGDPVDVILGPSEDAEWVYGIQQMSKASNFEKFDEQKWMIGFDSPNHARDAYLRQYDDERFFGGMSVISLEDFRAKLIAKVGAQITAELDEYEIIEQLDRVEKRVDGWVVLADDRKRVLATYDSEGEAIHRLAQIERFRQALTQV